MRVPLLTLGLLCCAGVACEGEADRADQLRPNRSYSGAPPVIPHAVRSLGRQECLDCHLEGEAVDEGGRAPVTPHPELERCQQCHVERVGHAIFRPNAFVGSFYRTGRRLQPAGPWLIPHPLTMRESCLGCHGRRAPERLRTSHPERARCLQCHLPDGRWPGPRPDVAWRE